MPPWGVERERNGVPTVNCSRQAATNVKIIETSRVQWVQWHPHRKGQRVHRTKYNVVPTLWTSQEIVSPEPACRQTRTGVKCPHRTKKIAAWFNKLLRRACTETSELASKFNRMHAVLWFNPIDPCKFIRQCRRLTVYIMISESRIAKIISFGWVLILK